MCGIVAYAGKDNAVPFLVTGLERVEYRGYDSAGVAVFGEDGRLQVEKSAGKIAKLTERLGKSQLKGNVGIGHTRWATHGEATDINAHPHTDCAGRIALVHNGTIDNLEQLRSVLKRGNHRLASETDTEFIAHLLEREIRASPSILLEQAVITVLKDIMGACAIAVMSEHEPGKIVVARRGSLPVIVGIGEDAVFAASDVKSFAQYVRQVVYLDQGELAVLENGSYRVLSMDGMYVEKPSVSVEEVGVLVDRGSHACYTLKEIAECGTAVEDALRGRLLVEEGDAKLGGLEEYKQSLLSAKRIVIVGCGTSYHAGLIGKSLIESCVGVPVEVERASEFRYGETVLTSDTLVLAISQSGETADTLEAILEAKRRGAMTAGIVNVVNSSIALEAGKGIYTRTGPEIGVASTKAFAAQVTVLTLLALWLGRRSQHSLSVARGRIIAGGLAEMPKKMNEAWERRSAVRLLVEKYKNAQNFLYLGRRYGFPVALEGALKLKELAYIHAEGCAAGEMKHGVIALIDEHMPVLVTAPSNNLRPKIISNIQEIKARRGRIIAVATDGDLEMQRLADDILFVPPVQELFEPLLYTISLYLFAYYMAVARGCDVDQPRNLAKSVTVE